MHFKKIPVYPCRFFFYFFRFTDFNNVILRLLRGFFFHVASGCSFIYQPSKKLNIGGCRNTLENESNKWGPCNIFEMDDCVLFKKLNSHIFFLLRILWSLSSCFYMWLFICSGSLHYYNKKIKIIIILKLLHNATTCWQEKWEHVLYNNLIYRF